MFKSFAKTYEVIASSLRLCVGVHTPDDDEKRLQP